MTDIVGNLLKAGLTTIFTNIFLSAFNVGIEFINNMNRQTDNFTLADQGPTHILSDPPNRISRETTLKFRIKTFDCPN